MEQEAKILRFPVSPMTFISRAVDRCPAFGAIVERLPPEGDELRPAAERALAEIFRRISSPPAVGREDADVLVDHLASRDDVIVEMMDRLPAAPERGGLASFWKEVWHRGDEAALRDVTLYFIALIGRLYAAEDAEPMFLKSR